MEKFVIVVHLMIVLAMIGFVLLQKSEGGGFAAGSTAGFLSSRGTANVLSRTTAYLAAAFFGTILQRTGGSPTAPAQPGAPANPLGGQGGGLLDQLQQRENAPAQPSGPPTPQSQ